MRAKVRWTLTLLIVGFWLGHRCWRCATRVVRPLQTLANLLAALREGDFSIRARGARHGDALGAVAGRGQRAGRDPARAAAGGARGHRAPAQGDGRDRRGRLRLRRRTAACGWSTGPASGCSGEPPSGCSAAPRRRSGWRSACEGEAPRIARAALPGRPRPLGAPPQRLPPGRPAAPAAGAHRPARALREEERQAWQRLVRVLGHEINNSLAPIRSIAGSLARLLDDRGATRRLGATTCGGAWP